MFLSCDPAGYAFSFDEWAYTVEDPWNFVDRTGWSSTAAQNAESQRRSFWTDFFSGWEHNGADVEALIHMLATDPALVASGLLEAVQARMGDYQNAEGLVGVLELLMEDVYALTVEELFDAAGHEYTAFQNGDAQGMGNAAARLTAFIGQTILDVLSGGGGRAVRETAEAAGGAAGAAAVRAAGREGAEVVAESVGTAAGRETGQAAARGSTDGAGSATARGADTVPEGGSAGQTVLIDSNIVYKLDRDPTAGGRIRPGETPVVSYVTKPEIRNAVAQSDPPRNPPGVMHDLPVLESRPVIGTVIDARAMGRRKHGVFGDGIIGAQAILEGLPFITNDRELARIVRALGGDVRERIDD